jgi:hypothetical protein
MFQRKALLFAATLIPLATTTMAAAQTFSCDSAPYKDTPGNYQAFTTAFGGYGLNLDAILHGFCVGKWDRFSEARVGLKTLGFTDAEIAASTTTELAVEGMIRMKRAMK